MLDVLHGSSLAFSIHGLIENGPFSVLMFLLSSTLVLVLMWRAQHCGGSVLPTP